MDVRHTLVVGRLDYLGVLASDNVHERATICTPRCLTPRSLCLTHCRIHCLLCWKLSVSALVRRGRFPKKAIDMDERSVKVT